MMKLHVCRVNEFFMFNSTSPTEIYTLSLHDALPISASSPLAVRIICGGTADPRGRTICAGLPFQDRKSTRLNSSHPSISYAVFCLKKKKIPSTHTALNTHANEDINIYTINTTFIHST